MRHFPPPPEMVPVRESPSDSSDHCSYGPLGQVDCHVDNLECLERMGEKGKEKRGGWGGGSEEREREGGKRGDGEWEGKGGWERKRIGRGRGRFDISYYTPSLVVFSCYCIPFLPPPSLSHQVPWALILPAWTRGRVVFLQVSLTTKLWGSSLL